jgi:hypothetical protein
MVVDHIGFFIFPGEAIYRIIGRLAFPLFAFLIVKGYQYTRDQKKYFLRLFIFANIIQVPSLFTTIPVNIFYTLSFGLLCIMIYESKYDFMYKIGGLLLVTLITYVVAPDYNIYGVLLIFVLHVFRDDLPKLIISFLLLNIAYFGLFNRQMFSIFSIAIMLLYNNQQGPKWKIFFYSFYPVHIVFLDWLSRQIRW